MRLKNDNDLEQAAGPSKRRRKICRTTSLMQKPSISKLQRRVSANSVTQKPGTVGWARRAKAELDAFSLFFPDEMIVMIVLFTNKIMELNCNAKILADTARTEDTNSSEMKCLSGMLLLHGVYHDTNKPVKDLWCSNLVSRPICRACFS